MPKINNTIIKKTLKYKEFVEEFNNLVNVTDFDSLNESDKKYYDYRKLNFQRSSRLEKIFEPNEETKNSISQIKANQTWFVITESWCGDSAQNLPIIAKLAGLNSLIDLKIVLRDSNLEFMDLHLTNGGRSIPKLIVFDKDDNELFRWGPRPVEAQKLFSTLKADGIEVSEIHKELHLWYGRNRGKEVEKEIAEFVKQDVSVV